MSEQHLSLKVCLCVGKRQASVFVNTAYISVRKLSVQTTGRDNQHLQIGKHYIEDHHYHCGNRQEEITLTMFVGSGW